VQPSRRHHDDRLIIDQARDGSQKHPLKWLGDSRGSSIPGVRGAAERKPSERYFMGRGGDGTNLVPTYLTATCD
jgi:predicted alpha/beta hydrolase